MWISIFIFLRDIFLKNIAHEKNNPAEARQKASEGGLRGIMEAII